MSKKNTMVTMLTSAIKEADSQQMETSSSATQHLIDIVVDQTSYAIGQSPNPIWLSGPACRTKVVMGKLSKLSNSDSGDSKIPGQPESGARWWGAINVLYTYDFGGKMVSSSLPAIKLLGCLINLNKRGSKNGVDTYGTEYVEIGIPFKVVINLIAAMNLHYDIPVVLGGVKLSQADKCCWVNASLRKKLDEEPHFLSMQITEEDCTTMTPTGELQSAEKELVNSNHDSCRSIINDPSLQSYYLCDLVLEPYGTIVLPDDTSPADISNFEHEVKFKAKVVSLICTEDDVVGSIPSTSKVSYRTTRAKGERAQG